VNVVLPAGPQGQPGDKGAPGQDGKAGATSIVVQSVEPPGANCPDGGTRIASGVDFDGDKQLVGDEIMEVTFVCNGAAGPAGARGTPGALLNVTPEPPGANCRSGGQRIAVGIDTNGNGKLDDSESSFSYVCNGETTTAPGDGGAGEPVVTCSDRSASGVLEIEPGTAFTVSGTVADAAIRPTTVMVNGVATPVASDGTFTAQLTARYGLNNVIVEKTDPSGRVTSDLCSFLVASRFVDEGSAVADAVTLRLNQAAIDDGARTGPIDSLADVAAIALNSDGLRAVLDKDLTAASPFYDDGFVEVRYLGSSLPGPNTVSASLIDGGVKLHAHIEDPQARIRVSFGVGPASVSADGDVNVDFVDVDVTFDVGQVGGRPQATIRSADVVVGAIELNFSASIDPVIDLVFGAVNGVVKQTMTNSLRATVNDQFNTTVNGIISNLAVSGLQAAFAVPRLDGTGNTPVTFGAGFSTIDASATRLLAGVSTRFTAPAAHTREPRRVPLPQGTISLDPAGSQSVAVAVHIGVLQQALQANWRGGGLDGTVAVLAAGGGNIAVTTTLPPVVFIRNDGTVGIDLVIDAGVALPFVLGGRTAVRAAGRAHASASLADDALTFSALAIDEFQFIAPGAPSDRTTAEILETILETLFTQMAERSLNDSLPRLPVPAFTVPDTLAPYGLPAGKQLGITGATLTLADRHAVLRGAFGIR